MDVISEAVAHSRAGRAVATRNRFAGSWSTRFPQVNGSGLHIIQQGRPWFVHEHGQPSQLSPRDVVFVPHGGQHGFSSVSEPFTSLRAGARTPHLNSYDVEFVSCCYHLDQGQVHASFGRLPQVVALPVHTPMLEHLTGLLSEHATDDRPGNEIALSAVVDLLLVHLLRAWHDDQSTTADPQISRALHAVQESPSRAWSVQELSDLAGLSRALFARRFSEQMGESPRTYLARRRLDRGAHLLRHTDQTLAAVAHQLGYSSEFSFSTAFRRHFGLAPGRFRSREHEAASGVATGTPSLRPRRQPTDRRPAQG